MCIFIYAFFGVTVKTDIGDLQVKTIKFGQKVTINCNLKEEKTTLFVMV